MTNAIPNQPIPSPARRELRRSGTDRWLGGVCGGLADFTGVASWAWRLMFTLLMLCAGTGVLVYLLMWVFVPEGELPFGQGRTA